MANPVASDSPWASVIVTCYNQASFVCEALASVVAQTYPKVELVVIDNASTDGSSTKIKEWMDARDFPIQFLPQTENVGICRAFNLGWRQSKGAFIIDLAADDVLAPDRVAVAMDALAQAGEGVGVHYVDTQEISESGEPGPMFFGATEKMPQGWVYEQVVARYCISAPGMGYRRTLLEALGGYDESLHYEDFDVTVRAARHWKFLGSEESKVYKRRVLGSKESERQQADSPHLLTTARVCEKIWHMNKLPAEYAALRMRLNYELKEALRIGHKEAAKKLRALSQQTQPRTWQGRLLEWAVACRF